jgi:hypothetical protein
MMMEEEDPELAAALALSMQVRPRDKPSLGPSVLGGRPIERSEGVVLVAVMQTSH